MNKERRDRAKKIDKAIRIVWDSLETHLKLTHTLTKAQTQKGTECGGHKFHQWCVKDYAKLIQILTELY